MFAFCCYGSLDVLRPYDAAMVSFVKVCRLHIPCPYTHQSLVGNGCRITRCLCTAEPCIILTVEDTYHACVGCGRDRIPHCVTSGHCRSRFAYPPLFLSTYDFYNFTLWHCRSAHAGIVAGKRRAWCCSLRSAHSRPVYQSR